MLLNTSVMSTKTGPKDHGNSEKAIMAAAEQLFLENGYKLTTTTMIARRAGVTHAMLHYYFRTKEHIFMKVLDKYMDELLDSFRPVMGKDAPFWETLRTGISTHFEFLEKHPLLPAFLYDTARFCPELLEAYKGRLRSTLVVILRFHYGMIRKEIDEGRIREVDPLQLMLDIVTLNLSAFMLIPVAHGFLQTPEPGDEGAAAALPDVLASRKEEIIELIRSRLYGGNGHAVPDGVRPLQSR